MVGSFLRIVGSVRVDTRMIHVYAVKESTAQLPAASVGGTTVVLEG